MESGGWRSRLTPCAGPSCWSLADKAGVSQTRFYKALIRKADARFTAHLRDLKES